MSSTGNGWFRKEGAQVALPDENLPKVEFLFGQFLALIPVLNLGRVEVRTLTQGPGPSILEESAGGGEATS